MKLTRLRIVGFKTFVEPTDFLIEPGLTGVVGPNGCGKSNLVEALRWVMGEASHKAMRASGMDDVIFSGSSGVGVGVGGGSGRPARNHAEVMLALDNAERTAPAAFNAADSLEVSRRIERESGSTYRVNGREVRARDVQLLFADAATGARSPAMVRQGQVAELIAAKPQARRRILEDAAGIAGLHARRHEAELRLKAAEDNLVRVEDVLGAIDSQAESLRRQARGAGRYRALSAEIRRLEALALLIGHTAARAEAAAAERAVEAALAAVARAQDDQARAATEQAVAAAALPGLREAEAEAAAGLQGLALALTALDAEERRAAARRTELARHLAELDRDAAREAVAREDAAATLARLARDAAEAEARAGESPARREAAGARAGEAEARLAEAEAALSRVQSEHAEAGARRNALERASREERERAARAEAERGRLKADLDRLAGPGEVEIARLRDALDAAATEGGAAETAAAESRAGALAAREAEARARPGLTEAETAASRLETEVRTLAKLLAPAASGFAPALDAVSAAPGYEVALTAALGDDLEAALDPRAPAHWAEPAGGAEPGDAVADPPLPEGAESLEGHVRAPDALRRRLRQIGIVPRDRGAALRRRLAPGQRLVSREGDLWRWDGLVQAAEAPSAAARRLAERNRLGDLTERAIAARDAAALRRTAFVAVEAASRAAAGAEAASLDRARRARTALDAARTALSAAERRAAESGQRRAALAEGLARVEAGLAEAVERRTTADAALAGAPPTDSLDRALAGAREAAARHRAATAEARAALMALDQEAAARQRRLAGIAAEQGRWGERLERAERSAAEIAERRVRARAEAARLAEAPDTALTERRRLQGRLAEAEAARKGAADRLAAGETAQAEGDRRARATLEALAAAREARAAAQAGYEALARRLADVARAIADALDVAPHELFALAGVEPGAALPAAGEVEPRLAGLKADRERLGGVNLRAEEELAEIEDRRGGLAAERDDLAEAIRRLRGAIGGLNREGRERLLAAFAVVDGHFRRLFATLFGGGTAELTLVDSDDPLEAGLEILARPPGKKPQTMTLLSGGEQALTATALIFAVFLTNPSPVCVLDEVDAPLDDANVERYCDLLGQMAQETETRFLVITHNPITMARMDRLYGVTMAERGVSQLVSVDLAAAAQLREAS